VTDAKIQTSPLAQRALDQISPVPSADEIKDAADYATIKIYDGLFHPGVRVTREFALDEYREAKKLYAKHRSLPGEYNENMAKAQKGIIEATHKVLPQKDW